MTPWLPSAFVNHLWQSTLFIAVVWLATLALRRNRARVRYWLWVAASVKFLVPLSALVSLGAQVEWQTAPAIAQPAAAFVMDEVLAPPRLPSVMADPVVAETSFVPWTLAGVWLAGCVAVLLHWVRQWMPIRRALRAAAPLSVGAGVDTGGLRLMCSSTMFEPGVVGIWRPVLLVPERLVDHLSPAQFQALIAHERCHVRCHDNFFAAVHMLVEAVFWFHPLVWWIERRLIDERERACDEAVLRELDDPEAYAGAILDVCRRYVELPLDCVSGISGASLKRRIEAIMTTDIGVQLSAARRVALAIAGFVAIAVPVAVGAVANPFQSSENLRAPADTPKWDAVSVRPCAPSPGPGRGGGSASVTPGRMVLTCHSIPALVGSAYVRFANGRSHPFYELGGSGTTIEGAPDWTRSETYTINATAEGIPSTAMLQGPMLQVILEDRFKLKVRRETRRGPMYELTVARGGPKLQPFNEAACVRLDPAREEFVPPPLPAGQRRCQSEIFPEGGETGPPRLRRSPPAAMQLVAEGATVEEFAKAFLTGVFIDRPIIDRTGITGRFDFRMRFAPALPETTPLPENAGPSIFTALEEQLGLKLEPATGPREVIVIESVERPSEN